MDRKRRKASPASPTLDRAAELARSFDSACRMAGVPDREKNNFLRWMLKKEWEQFTNERMNQRIMIENEIRQLGLRLPNGTVGKDYKALLNLPTDRISNIELLGAEELGLNLTHGDDGYCAISGKPVTAGDFTLILKYNTVEGEPESELKIPIAFNPNPRDLWKNIPTPKDIAFYKPDSESDFVKVATGADGLPRKDMVAASQRGRSHAQEGKARDDHYILHHCPDSDWYIMAVADGAGSAKYSRKGSEVACNTVVDHCRELLSDSADFDAAIREYSCNMEDTDLRTKVTRMVIDIIYSGALKAHKAITALAGHEEEYQIKDFSTTLLYAICKRFEKGWFIASFWVGDGAMGLFDRNSETIKLLGTPDEGEFSGQTRFLTMQSIFRDPDIVSKRLRMAIVPDFTALFLMTDGVSDPMFETDNRLNSYQCWEDFYAKLTGGFPDDGIGGVDLSDDNEAAREQLLRWLDFWSPGNHDDRTLAILF